jgi:dTDP-4-amino-4,6-dideoxygalactose transaminase
MIPKFQVQYGFKDFLVALGSVLSRSPTGDFRLPGFDVNGLQFLPTRRGREALYLLLGALGLPRGGKVGIPLYTCSVVAQTVIAAGLRPIFLDADPETFGVSLADLQVKAPGLDCLILVHAFGYPAHYDCIRSLMANKPIIEDCAHGLGSRYCGQAIGCLGYAGFFAFGLFKPLSTSGGGCIVTKDRSLADRLRSSIQDAPVEPALLELRHAVQSLLYGCAFRRPTYTVLSLIVGHSASLRGGGVLPKRIISEFLRMRRVDRSVLTARVRTSSLHDEGVFWAEVRKNLPAGWRVPPEPCYGEWNHFILPIRAPDSGNCAQGISRLRDAGVAAGRLYRACASTAKLFGYAGGCAEAERLAESVLVLPSHAALSRRDRRQILRCLRQLGDR